MSRISQTRSIDIDKIIALMSWLSCTNFVVVIFIVWLVTNLLENSSHSLPAISEDDGSTSNADLVSPRWAPGTTFSLFLFLQQGEFERLQPPPQRQFLLRRDGLRYGGYNESMENWEIDLVIREHSNEKDVPRDNQKHDLVHVPVSTEIWEVLQTNRTELFLHIAILRAEDTPVFSESHLNQCSSDEPGVNNGLCLQQSEHADAAEVGGDNQVDLESALHGRVRLLKYDKVPNHFRRRYLLSNLGDHVDRLLPGFLEKLRIFTRGYFAGQIGYSMSPEDLLRYTSTAQYISFWKPEVSIRMVEDWTTWKLSELPRSMYHSVVRAESKAALGSESAGWQYNPSMCVDEIGLTSDKYIPLNKSLEYSLSSERGRRLVRSVLPLRVTLSAMSLQQWSLMSQIEGSLRLQKDDWGFSDNDLDDVRRLVTDTPVTLLLVTFVASTLHLIFEFLAFHSDVEFWRENTSVEGISVRSLIGEFVSQVIVFLYLCEGDTSRIITLPALLGILIQFWKVCKATGLELCLSFPFIHLHRLTTTVPQAENEENETLSGSQQTLHDLTREADSLATTTVAWLFSPMVMGYSVYQLLYEMHYGWYSWLINTLTASVYAFGFALMFPQLYINHRLRSVSRLPWKVLMFKFVSTFIDDLFAFVIHMPTMHRVSCFRDDVIFIIYLYQRWIYTVDESRPVER